MSNGRYRRNTTFVDPESNPTNVEDLWDRLSSASIQANPQLRSGFDYSQLEEKFPVRSVAGRYEVEKQRRQEEPFFEEDLEYKKSRLEDKIAELNIKKTSRDLDMYEARINREDAMLEQAPLARQALGELDPRDPDYIKQRMKVFNEYPLAFEYEPFLNNVDKPLLERHQRTANARSIIDEGGVGLREYQSAMGEISKYASIRENRDLSQAELDYLSDMGAIVDQYRGQQGVTAMPQTSTPLSPEPAGAAPMNIPSPEEDDEIYAEANAVIARNPALKDRVNQRLIQMGRKPIE
jgi:hypothetical protein